MKIVFSIILFFVGLDVYTQDLDTILDRYNDHSIPYITPLELRELQIQDTIWILDAREWEEFEVSHIPNAHYVGFNNFSEMKTLQDLPNKEVSIIVYCSIGVRSEKIGKQLNKIGFRNIRNLYGGIFEWVNLGFPVENSAGEETERVHAFSKKWGQYLHKGQKVY